MKKKCMELAPSLLFPWFSSLFLYIVIYLALPRQFGIGQISKWHFVVGMVGTFLVAGFRIVDGLKKIWSILLVGALALIVHLLVGFSKMTVFWQEYVKWMLGKPILHEEWFRIFTLFQCVGIVALAGVIWILLQRFSRFMGCYSLGMILLLGLGVVLQWKVSTPGAAAMLAFSLYLGLLWQLGKHRDQRNAQFMFFMTPLFVVMVVCLSYMPSSMEPYHWPVSRKLLQQLGANLENVQEGLRRISYNLRVKDWETGGLVDSFADRANIDGNHSKSYEVFMEIERSSEDPATIYLIGNSWTGFDGREWTREVDKLNDSLVTDTSQTMYTIYRYTSFWGDCFKTIPLEITYRNFHSAEPFLPLKVKKVSEIEGTVGKEKQLGYGATYSFSAVILNLSHPVFTQMVQMADDLEEDKSKWRTASEGQYLNLDYLAGYIDRTKREYREEITLSDALVDWKNQAIANYTEQLLQEGLLAEGEELSEYQRLLAMEQELSQLTYQLNPGDLPKEVQSKEEYLEYFLLDSQEGYCLHFATAMVLLAQSEGMPARLTQGFCVPLGNQKKVEVTADMAHAWAEVYFENVGWIPFEATPGYGSERYQPWKVSSHEVVKQEEQVWDAYLQQMEEKHRAEEEAREREEEEKRIKQEEKQALLRGEKNQEILLAVSDLLWKIAIGVLVFWVLALLCLMIYILWRRKLFRKMSVEDKFRTLFHRNLLLLEQLGLHKGEEETLEEFAIRVEAEGLSAINTLQTMEERRYAGKELQQDCLKAVFDERVLLTKELEKHRGKKMFVVLEKVFIASLTKYI